MEYPISSLVSILLRKTECSVVLKMMALELLLPEEVLVSMLGTLIDSYEKLACVVHHRDELDEFIREICKSAALKACTADFRAQVIVRVYCAHLEPSRPYTAEGNTHKTLLPLPKWLSAPDVLALPCVGGVFLVHVARHAV